MHTLKLLGIDPGLANFAMAFAEAGEAKLLFTGIELVKTLPDADRRRRKTDETAERCRWIAMRLNDAIQREKPAAICVEAIALPFGRIQQSVVSALGRVRGIIDGLAEIHQLPVLEAGSQTLKKQVTGSVKASKLEVQQALEKAHPELRFLWPAHKDLHEHAADAAGLIYIFRSHEEVQTLRRIA